MAHSSKNITDQLVSLERRFGCKLASPSVLYNLYSEM